MCDARVSKVVSDCSRGNISSHRFKSSFAKSMVVELTDKQSQQDERSVLPNISCSRVKDYHDNRHLSLRTSSSVSSLDRNLIRKHAEFKGKYHICESAANFEKDHKQADEERQQLKLVMEGRAPPRDSQLCNIDTVVLQSRVDTLQWQLKQAEESRQVYRSLMEHVMKFLERVYTNLDEMSRMEQCKSLPSSKCNSPSHRVPRSQSALSFDAAPFRSATRGNRETTPSVSRAKSTAQIEESQSVFCDYTWQRTPKVTQDSKVTAQKLSQEAYRLLRTVQSFLNTSEPNLAQNTSLSDTYSENQRTQSRNDSFARLSPDADSLQRSMQDLSFRRISPHNTPVENLGRRNYPATTAEGSFSSLRREHSRRHVPLHSTLTVPRDSHLDFELESPGGHLVVPHYTASLGRPKKLESKLVVSRAECYVSETPSEKQLSLSSNEDESGFSSMSSFQEVGLPPVPASSTPSPEDVPSYPQVGVPVFETGDCSINHRRWSSLPVDTHAHSQLAPVMPESVTVMWV